MKDTILNVVKKLLGITEDDTSFDTDITILINANFATLTQLGIGPPEGFTIQNETKWDEYETIVKLDMVKEYIYIKTKIAFDPPQSSFILESFNKIASEAEWRIKTEQELYSGGD